MFSLILAALYVGCRVLFSDAEPLAAFENTLGFLWYWHLTFAILKGLLWTLVPILGVAFGASGDDKQKVAGIAAVVASPFLLVLMLLSSALFLGGVYGMNSGIENGVVVNQNHLVVGVILYFIAVISQLRSHSTSSSSKD